MRYFEFRDVELDVRLTVDWVSIQAETLEEAKDKLARHSWFDADDGEMAIQKVVNIHEIAEQFMDGEGNFESETVIE